jgi:serine/threonine protein phosphatase PrpC
MADQSASISLLGDREENQDRVKVLEAEGVVLLIAIDGMGGHSDGAKAAALAIETIEALFLAEKQPVFDPQGFMHRVIGRAHAALVDLGSEQRVVTRPRATCALCLIQDGAAYWGHVGDSRIYQLRGTTVHDRTRDHSHIEVLLYDGRISEDELENHPMRNYVECCLGGDTEIPHMSISTQKTLQQGDVLLVCSDGFWSPLNEEQLADLGRASGTLADNLETLCKVATRLAAPHSDNASAAALRVAGED